MFGFNSKPTHKSTATPAFFTMLLEKIFCVIGTGICETIYLDFDFGVNCLSSELRINSNYSAQPEALAAEGVRK